MQKTGKGVPFFEFRWSFFFNYASFYNTSYWPSDDQLVYFLKLYHSLTREDDVNNIIVDDWFSLANNVIALCRSSSTASYVLPSELYGEANLPGYIEGYSQLPADPDCSTPTCA